MISGGGEILEKNLYTILASVEMVSLLRVLTIFHIFLCLPLRWLAENYVNLEEYEFGVADMPLALDLMDDAMAEMMANGDLLLDDAFMMEIFKPIADRIKPFKDYLLYRFEEKKSSLVGSRNMENKVLP